MIEQFIQERKYLKAVTPKTLAWYKDSFKAFEGALDSTETINRRIVELRKRGIKPVSVNTWLRCVKAYYLWQGKEWKVGRLKEEENLLPTLSPEAISRLINWKGVGVNLHRAHLVALVVLDTGLRASEVLGLTKENMEFDNLVIKTIGKGGKHRLVPFSVELRKSIFRHASTKQFGAYLFGTKNETKVSVRNLERDFQILGKKCGITGRFHPHLLRHVFALSYLKNGGDLFTLSRILGHSSVSTTQIYLRSMGIEQISEAHSRFSPLSARRN